METDKRCAIYQTSNGCEPFTEYIESLRDHIAVAKIKARIRRAMMGNLGDYRSARYGVIELRIHYGSGYRVYLGLQGHDMIVLLCAGDKSSQDRDIQNAHAYWDHYRRNV